MSNREVGFICIQSAAAAVAAALYVAMVYTAVAAAAVLLLPAAVRHRVPDGQICGWSIESDPSVFFLFIQTRFLYFGPSQYCVAFTASICLHPR